MLNTSTTTSASRPPVIGVQNHTIGTGNSKQIRPNPASSIARPNPSPPHNRRVLRPNAFLLFRSRLYAFGVLLESTHQSTLSITAARLWRGMSREEKAPWFEAAAEPVRARENANASTVGNGGRAAKAGGVFDFEGSGRDSKTAMNNKRKARERMVERYVGERTSGNSPSYPHLLERDTDINYDSDAISESGCTISSNESSCLYGNIAPTMTNFLQLEGLTHHNNVGSIMINASASASLVVSGLAFMSSNDSSFDRYSYQNY